MKQQLEAIRKMAEEAIQNAKDQTEIEALRVKY